MAQSEITATSLTFTSSGSQAAEITSLRTAIGSGSIIYANDLNRISTLINNMNGHYHTYTDSYQLATYGNNGDRTNYSESKNTGAPNSITSAPTDTAANTTITAARHNELKDAINNIRNHYHEINDRTS